MDRAMTVGELVAKLEEYEPDTPVFLTTSDGVFAHRLIAVREETARVYLTGPRR